MKSILKSYISFSASVLFMLIFSLFIINNAFSYSDIKGSNNSIVGVRVLDYINYGVKEISNLPFHLKEIKKHLKDEVSGKLIHIFFNTHLQKRNNSSLLSLTAFIYQKSISTYEFYNIQYSFNKNYQFSNIRVSYIANLAQTKFQVNVSLVNRKMILLDTINNIKMIFPLGVGALDERVLNDGVSTLTPRFTSAYLDQRAAIAARKKPRYFMSKPFLRITTDKNLKIGHTGIGFHVQPNLDRFVRAFDSHGCMRMQTFDLDLLHIILSQGPHRRLKVQVKYRLADKSEHPFPKRNKSYKTVLNNGTKDNPTYAIDRDLLVQLRTRRSTVPLHQLKDQSDDNYHELFDYDMKWRKKLRWENVRSSCKSDHRVNPDNYKIDEGQYVINQSQYTVKWINYKPTYDFFETDRSKNKKLKKAQKKYAKAQKLAKKKLKQFIKNRNRKRQSAIKRLQRAKEAAEKRSKKLINDCIKKSQRNNSFSDRMYRWWVH